VQIVRLQQVRSIGARRDRAACQSRLLRQLAPGAGLGALAVLEMATGESPGAGAVRPSSLAEQHVAVADDQDADTYLGVLLAQSVRLSPPG